MKHTIFGLIQIATAKPQTIAISAVIAAIFNYFVLYMGILAVFILLDAVLGSIVANEKKEFDIRTFFKKTGIKLVVYASGIAAILIISYYPFTGQQNEILGWSVQTLVLWFITNEYLSIAAKGKKLGYKLAPDKLLKQLKEEQKN